MLKKETKKKGINASQLEIRNFSTRRRHKINTPTFQNIEIFPGTQKKKKRKFPHFKVCSQ